MPLPLPERGSLVSFPNGHGVVTRIVGKRAVVKTDSGRVSIHLGLLTSEPTAAEIRQRCEVIQGAWSAEERERRAVHYAGDGNRAAAGNYKREAYTVPVVRMVDVEALAG
ncbi:MAG: hypothetical protein WD851_19575 [Pirellulales bacterium]